MRGYAAVWVCLVCLLASIGSCGGGAGTGGLPRAVPSARPVVTPDQVDVGPGRSISLSATLAELDALGTPPGVDPAAFAELKAEFEKILLNLYGPDGTPRGKAPSALSLPEMTKAWISDGKYNSPAEVQVRWYGRHTGDYDINSEVNVSDITPLGLYLGQMAEYDEEGVPVERQNNEHKCQVDGDINGEINISDLTVIGINMGSVHLGYRVYAGYSQDGENFTWEPAYLQGPESPAGVTVGFNHSTKQGEVMRYQFAFEMAALPDAATPYVKIVPFNGTAEGLAEIMPVYPGPHSAFYCNMCHTRVEKLFLGEENSCHNCHNEAPEGGAWDTAPLMHQPCLNCHASHLFTIDPPESVCSTCHASIAGQLTQSGMTACLSCHETPHIPVASPPATTCGACHADQAAELAGGSMTDCKGCHNEHAFVITDEPATCKSCHTTPPDAPGTTWAEAPGLHGTCQECHNQHTFGVLDTNNICANCHPEKYTDGHAPGGALCLSCHVSAHVPEAGMGELGCTDCHTNPPEDTARQWAEAPGLHADCGQCHSLTEHGDKPVPPESICANCHQPLIDGDHAGGITTCMDCHVFPHLPESNTGGLSCIQCHPVPPEAPGLTWADMPGDHDQCGECHVGASHPVPKPTKEQIEPTCIGCHPDFNPEIPGNHPGPNSPEGGAYCLDCHTLGPHTAEFDETSCDLCHPFP